MSQRGKKEPGGMVIVVKVGHPRMNQHLCEFIGEEDHGILEFYRDFLREEDLELGLLSLTSDSSSGLLY
jgi:hypothetical protein